MDMKEVLKAAIKDALQIALEQGELPEGAYPEAQLEVPPQKEFGDFSTNIAMQSARVAKSNPKAIAEIIISHMNYDWLTRAEVAGAGFINFFLASDVIYDTLKNILTTGDTYGNAPLREEDTVQIEYVSANPTGLLHVGHGRGAAYGSALVNLMRAAGYNVFAEYYINDAGKQIDNLAASVNARYLELLDMKHEFPESGYRGQDVIDTAQELINWRGDFFAVLPEEERVPFFKEFALTEKLNRLRKTLRNFRVGFDRWFSERSLHKSGEIRTLVNQLLESGGMYEKDGAYWLASMQYGDDKDRVVIRDNGEPTYLAADIAYHKDKYERGYKQLINIWGADHHGYIARVKAAMEALGFNPDKLEVLLLQMVFLYRDGELVKMSKRTGETITLDELIEDVGVDAARYFFLMRSLDSQLDFDINLASSKSNDNPVYYIQYAHARIHSIFGQVKEAGIAYGDWANTSFTALQSEQEVELIKKLAAYPEEIQLSANNKAPHRIAKYLYDVASLFHSFYKQGRIMGVEPELQQARLGLITATAHVLQHGLGILGISAPEKM